jgi:hypothetical protein
VEENNLNLISLSWHEFNYPEDIEKNTNKIRSVISDVFNSKLNLKIQEICINEYGSSNSQLIPGWTIGWLYCLEKANMNIANRACWNETSGTFTWNNC